MANVPAKCLEDVQLHLYEQLSFVALVAHKLELADGGDAPLFAVLGSDPEGRAADQLIVALVDDAARAIPVEEVDSQEEGFWKEPEGSVSLDHEVDERVSHGPIDLRLDVHVIHIRQGFVLSGVSQIRNYNKVGTLLTSTSFIWDTISST